MTPPAPASAQLAAPSVSHVPGEGLHASPGPRALRNGDEIPVGNGTSGFQKPRLGARSRSVAIWGGGKSKKEGESAREAARCAHGQGAAGGAEKM